jgi:hypothetical protein
MQSNLSAQHFWERAITEFTGEAADSAGSEKDGELWRVFRFESMGAA